MTIIPREYKQQNTTDIENNETSINKAVKLKNKTSKCIYRKMLNKSTKFPLEVKANGKQIRTECLHGKNSKNYIPQ